ncbi:MAG: D-alanyl-D-alanine carboxypeptidase [Micavibrio aeruginosavorus]|nr:D-alanyl-D-alanine carboxypeptidase [Micavibrio aeruginosavorus]
MQGLSLSHRFLRHAALALTLVFTGVAMMPVDADAASNKKTDVRKKGSPKKAPSQKAQRKKAPAYEGGPKAWIYVNAETGEILAESGAAKSIEPASLTKEMTAIVVFEAIRAKKLSLNDTLPLAAAPGPEADGAVTLRRKTGTTPGTPLSIHTLLAATAVASAADATVTLAKAVCGNEDCFTDLMNKKVREILGVRPGERSSTHYVNSHGMPGNRTTAKDLAKIHQYMIETYPRESRYFSLTSYEINGRTYPGHNALLVDYKCRNSLGLPYKCMEASKTGFFRKAGFGIVGSAAWNGYRGSHAPKTASQPWHFPSMGKEPPMEPEPEPELPENSRLNTPANTAAAGPGPRP